MRIRLAIPDRIIDPEILNAALEATTRANQRLLDAGEAPSIREAIRSGLRWRPEQFTDGEHFDLAPIAARRGWGDCDDLAPWLAAEMRLRGDKGARAVVKRSGPKRWHVLVRDGDGRIVDPSRWAGMGKGGEQGVHAAVSGPMAAPGEGAMCLLPHGGGWVARCDLPWGARHWSGLSAAGSPELALLRAARGAAVVGEEMGLGEDELEGLDDLLDGLCGDVEESETVGSFLDALTSAASSILPGGLVGPTVTAALPQAGSLLKGLTGGAQGGGEQVPAVPVAAPASMPRGAQMAALPLPGGGHVAYSPSSPGPVIVRF